MHVPQGQLSIPLYFNSVLLRNRYITSSPPTIKTAGFSASLKLLCLVKTLLMKHIQLLYNY